MPRRSATLRDHQERMNRVLLHIQQHLDEELSLEVLARVACFSPYHLHRVFAAHTGETLHAHVRRLRLEQAAVRLRSTDAPVTEIALAAGFDTTAAFDRAFRAHFDQTPTAYRRSATARLRTSARPEGGINLDHGGAIMEPEIRTLDDQPVIFVRRTGSYAQSAAAAWEAVCQFAGARGLMGPDVRFIGISLDDPQVTAEEKLRYDACITVAAAPEPEGEVGVQTIPGGRYAVFLHQGPYERLHQTYAEIFGRWLPHSGEALRDAPSFELYLNAPQQVAPEELRTEIFVPLK